MKKGEEVEFGKGMRRREWDEKGMRRKNGVRRGGCEKGRV